MWSYGRDQLGCCCGYFRKLGFQAMSVAVFDHDGDFHGLALCKPGGSWAGYGDSFGQWWREVV